MSAGLIFVCVALYTVMLFAVTWITSRKATNETYFVGNRSSHWYLVAYGMVGASLSGVTFMSVPGETGQLHFSYFQMVLGYVLGYLVIAFVLLPVYYRLNLTSIYTYLQQRLGNISYRTGAFFFLLSRTIGAAFRMFIVVNVLQVFVFSQWGIPFWVTTAVFVILILLYTYEGGVKTIVWTDTLQTTFMLLSLVLSVILIAQALNYDWADTLKVVWDDPRSTIINSNWQHPRFFPKAFFGGMFIAIAMTGLDQEMMQKNISCKSLREAQKNMMSFTVVLVLVNFLFLALGVLLWKYTEANQILVSKGDLLFPTVALHHLGTVSAVFFVIGLISAAYPSADGALTALTASFCIDFLGFNDSKRIRTDAEKKRLRHLVHICFATLLLVVVVVFRIINNESVVTELFKAANYTYGPLLGLFMFGILTKRVTIEKFVPVVCLVAPIVCYILNLFSKDWLSGYVFGNELLLINGMLTFAGLWITSAPVNALKNVNG